MHPPSSLRLCRPRVPLFVLLFLCCLSAVPCVRPFDVSDFDAYGVKVAGNEWVCAEVINQANSLGYIQFFTSYTAYPLSTPQHYCAVYLDETWYAEQGVWSMFAYGVAVGLRDSTTQSVVWWGESDGGNWNDQSDPIQMTVAAFSGVTIVPDYSCYPNNATTDTNGTPATLSVAVGHEEFFQLAVQPEGNYAVGIANTFGFTMNLIDLNSPSLFTHLWTRGTQSPLYTASPLDNTFGPRAVALETAWGVTAGWVQNEATKQWFLVALLFAHTPSSLTLLDRWQFAPNASSYLSSINTGDASTWKPQHDLSLALRQDGAVLLGCQLYNSVFLFRLVGGRLVVVGVKSRGAKAVGFGKTVSWTSTGAAQVLYNAYSADYSTITAPSAIELYDVPAAAALNSSLWTDDTPLPRYVYPNPTQQLAAVLTTSTFTTALSTPSNLVILDQQGSILFIQPAPPGLYQPTVSGYDAQLPCPPGSYNNDTSYEACQLCQAGTYRDASIGGGQCAVCGAGAFCPLGSVAQVSASMLVGEAQTFVYPSSPESVIFDDIIIHNIFFLHSPSHCIAVSPVFWGLMVLAVLFLILGCMFRLRYCVNDAKSRKIRRLTKFIFKRTDLVKEGEHWIGGLMSFVLIVFIIMGIWFSTMFIAQYPMETAANPGFACETTYNAKFASSMQSVALPPDEEAAPMYDMLSEQALTLGVDVLNTNVSCDDASAAVVTSVTTALPFTCQSTAAGTISLSATLPDHSTTVQFTLKGAQLVGGLRLSIAGAAGSSDKDGNTYQLRQVSASQALYIVEQTLQKEVALPISLTKVINVTDPLSSGGAKAVSGLWIPVFPTPSDSMFMSQQSYLTSSSTPFLLTLSLSETPFWVYNQQSPIARSSEAAFKTLLYIIMLLEVFGLAFLVFKLAQPLVHCVALKGKGRSVKKVWDQADSSDEEEDWLEDLLYGDRVKPMGSGRGGSGRASGRGAGGAGGGVRELTEEEKMQRAKARQERRDAREGGRTPREQEAEQARQAAAAQGGQGGVHAELEMPLHPQAVRSSSIPEVGSEAMEATEV